MTTMTSPQSPQVEDLNGEVTRLSRLRDEAKLKMRLAEADAREEWQGLEKKWDHFRAVVEKTAEESRSGLGEATAEVRQGFDHMAEELRTAYERIRRAL